MTGRLASTAALALALTACTTTMGREHGSLMSGDRYVAMGSSYAAGPGVGGIQPGTSARCTRSGSNYASLLAARFQLSLIDVSCGGATTAHVLGPWNELAAQIDAVTSDTRLVTITIGGNDVGFVRNLFAALCNKPGAAAPPGGFRCPAQAAPTAADWVGLETNLRKIARDVRAKAPAARLIFVDYVAVLPHGRSCRAVPLDAQAMTEMQGVAERLAKVTARVAREEGADLLSAGKLSRRHTPCDSEPWSVGAPESAPGVPWHPNAAGMAAISEALAARLRS